MFTDQYRLWCDRGFKKYILSCALAMFGNGLTYIIMVWVLLRFDTSVVSMAILMACFWLPCVLFGPFFGVLADRLNRKKLLLLANSARALCLFAFAFVDQANMSALAIYFLATVIGALLAVYVPVAMSFVRELVSEEDLLSGNAMVDIAYELGGVAGMGSAGFLLAFASFSGCFFINAGCYVIAILLLLSVPYQPTVQTVSKKKSMIQEFLAGGRYIVARPTLLLVYLTQGLFFVSYMTAPVLLVPYANNTLHTSVTQFGWLESMLSLGIIIGGVLSPWLASVFRMSKIILVQVLLGVAGFYLFSHTLSIHLAIFYQFLIGLSFSSWALLTTLAQEMTILSYQGRVQSLFNSVSGVIIILFYYLLTQWKDIPVTDLYSGEIALLVIAFFLLIIYMLRPKESSQALKA